MRRAIAQSALSVSMLCVSCSEAPPPPSHPPPAPAAVPTAEPIECAVGRADCDGNRTNDCETDIDFRVESCGECGRACETGERCVFGHCRRTGILHASLYHTCALTADGGARCWGNNLQGQLGDGTNEDSVSRWGATRVSGLADVVTVAAGGEIVFGATSCALLRSGQVSCWGIPLGSSPAVQGGWENAIDISVTSARVCAALRDGTIRCADLGDRGDFAVPTYEKLGGITDAVQVEAAAFRHHCALRRSGEVVCWGDDAEMSTLKVVQHIDDQTVVARVPRVTNAVQISCGIGHDCALLRGGRVRCWGSNEVGQLGNGGTNAEDQPATEALVDDAVEIAAGGEQTCALRKNGEVWCWGNNEVGQLGNGKVDPVGRPGPVLGVKDAVHVTAGDGFGCAARASGGTVCWGKRGYLGAGMTPGPHTLPGVTAARGVFVGESWVCALQDKGVARCFTRASGESTPPAPPALPPMQDVTAMFGKGPASESFCVVRKAGKVDCWEDLGSHPRPYTLTGIGPATSVILGSQYQHTGAALLASGRVAALSLTSRSETQEGPFSVTSKEVPGLQRVKEIAGHATVVCAVLASGEAHCVDLLDTGGGPVKFGRSAQLKVFDAVRISGYHGDLAILHKDGTVSTAETSSADGAAVSLKKVAGVSGAVQVTVGMGFACARLASGEVTCWGKNGCGQLGSGGYARRETPALVTGLKDTIAIDASELAMCAARKDGSVTCWGCDVLTPDQYAHPVPVVDEPVSP